MNDLQMLGHAADQRAISFARGYLKSEAFLLLFREGMGLVEDTASYLDGEGRAASAALPREVSLNYATESMRLTTRLMQIASWLLVQRAVAEGEMTSEQARAENNKVRISEPMIGLAEAEFELLPVGLRNLIAHSNRLQDRIRHLKGQMEEEELPVGFNPVQHQLASLHMRLGLAL
jgi:regulator of CtrA degradation